MQGSIRPLCSPIFDPFVAKFLFQNTIRRDNKNLFVAVILHT